LPINEAIFAQRLPSLLILLLSLASLASHLDPTTPSETVESPQMITISECRYRWLRLPATTDTDAPVVKAAGAFFFVTIPIACLEASLYERYWRKAVVRGNVEVKCRQVFT
jgi:hypothetical protein